MCHKKLEEVMNFWIQLKKRMKMMSEEIPCTHCECNHVLAGNKHLLTSHNPEITMLAS